MRQRGQRKTQLPSSEVRDRWMITYADLITLLLIFFVVLFAMSSLDSDKYEIVTDSLSHSLHSGSSVFEKGDGILDRQPQPKPPAEESGVTGQPSESDTDVETDLETDLETDPKSDQETDTPAVPSARELAFREQEVQLTELMGVITKYVQDNNLGDQIFVEDKPQGIAITLSDRFLFDAGDAALKPPSVPALQKLSGLFNGIGAVISIEGHTDNTPVSAFSSYKDNWDLSGARALSVLRFFLEEQGLKPEEFQYAGYADTRPAANNSTEAGKQKNRRVEIIVLRQLQKE